MKWLNSDGASSFCRSTSMSLPLATILTINSSDGFVWYIYFPTSSVNWIIKLNGNMIDCGYPQDRITFGHVVLIKKGWCSHPRLADSVVYALSKIHVLHIAFSEIGYAPRFGGTGIATYDESYGDKLRKQLITYFRAKVIYIPPAVIVDPFQCRFS